MFKKDENANDKYLNLQHKTRLVAYPLSCPPSPVEGCRTRFSLIPDTDFAQASALHALQALYSFTTSCPLPARILRGCLIWRPQKRRKTNDETTQRHDDTTTVKNEGRKYTDYYHLKLLFKERKQKNHWIKNAKRPAAPSILNESALNAVLSRNTTKN